MPLNRFAMLLVWKRMFQTAAYAPRRQCMFSWTAARVLLDYPAHVFMEIYLPGHEVVAFSTLCTWLLSLVRRNVSIVWFGPPTPSTTNESRPSGWESIHVASGALQAAVLRVILTLAAAGGRVIKETK